MVSIKKVLSPKIKTIKIDDLVSLNELLKTNLSLRNCLDLIQTRKNEAVFKEIVQKLNEGNMIENVIGEYLPKEIATYCIPLLNTMSFADALNLALSFKQKIKENIKSLQKEILYPFVLLFVSLTALYLFDAYALDYILSMLRSFSNSLPDFGLLRVLLRIVVYIFYFGMLIIIALLLYFTKNRNIALLYVLVCRYFPNSLVQTYFCEEFVSLFIICLDLGYKTKDALTILKSLHNKPVTSLLAFHLDEKLLNGDSLKQASIQPYYDTTLTSFINVAVYTNNFNKILKDYVNFSRSKIIRAMKKLTTIIQLNSYILIGVVIVFIYQILFLPMQAITNF